jgi:PAP2 superfamily
MHVQSLRSPTVIGLRPADRRFAGATRVAREVLLLVGMFVGYRQIRYLSRNDTDQAMANARAVVRLERSVHAFLEPGIQNAALHWHTAVALFNRYYVTVHFPITVLFVLWVLVRHSEWYRPIRTWLIAVTAAALVIHVGYPLAPPRMLAHEGFVDTLREFGPNIYPADTSRSIANQFAAMPSLHFGWAAIVGAGFVAIRRTRTSWLAMAHPIITLLAIVATANHYLLDAFVALVLVVAAGLVLGIHRRRPAAARTIGGRSARRQRSVHPVAEIGFGGAERGQDPRHLTVAGRQHPEEHVLRPHLAATNKHRLPLGELQCMFGGGSDGQELGHVSRVARAEDVASSEQRHACSVEHRLGAGAFGADDAEQEVDRLDLAMV